MSDLKPIFKKVNGDWVKQDAFEMISGNWVRISTSLNLPNEYSNLEYIESTGTQWIDTNIKGKDISQYKIKFSITNKKNWQIMFGDNGTNASYMGRLMCMNSTTTIYWEGAGVGCQLGTVGLNDIHEIEIKQNEQYIDGVLISNKLSKSSGNNNYYLFTNSTTASSSTSLMRFYNLVTVDVNGNINHNFIPVLRNSDHKIGIYDAVSNVFYQNSGTGEFIYKTGSEETNIWEEPIQSNDNLVITQLYSISQYENNLIGE